MAWATRIFVEADKRERFHALQNRSNYVDRSAARCYPMRLTQGIDRATRLHPSKPATVFKGRQRTWIELRERVARLASALRSRGIGPGQRVAVLALNSDAYLECYFGVLWSGAVIVPLNTRWSEPEIVYAIQDCAASALVVDASFAHLAQDIAASCPTLQLLICTDESSVPPRAVSFDALVAQSEPIADQAGNKDELAGIFYTGGTTGFPKGVMLSHANIFINALAMSSVMRLGSNTVYLHAAPMFHVADASFVFSITLFGGTHVIVPGFEPEVVCRTMADSGVTDTLLVPTMIGMILDHCERTGEKLAGLQQLVYGASPMPEALLRRTIAALPQTRLVQGFGQTELSPVATLLEPEFHVLDGINAGRLRSAGRALVGVDVKIVAPDGTEQPAGEVGEVWVRGPNTMLGYWNKPELTAETISDGWVRMGDAAYMDADGFVYVVDRLKDMIVSGGENVYSAEVENALMQHPGVAECAVIGVPDPRWGERVHAVVVPRSATAVLSADELIAHCRSLIAGYKCPRSVELRLQPLPRSAPGKVLKAELRKAYWQDRERAVN